MGHGEDQRRGSALIPAEEGRRGPPQAAGGPHEHGKSTQKGDLQNPPKSGKNSWAEKMGARNAECRGFSPPSPETNILRATRLEGCSVFPGDRRFGDEALGECGETREANLGSAGEVKKRAPGGSLGSELDQPNTVRSYCEGMPRYVGEAREMGTLSSAGVHLLREKKSHIGIKDQSSRQGTSCYVLEPTATGPSPARGLQGVRPQ